MNTDRPIFLLGPGRSGSTLLNNIITLHRDVGYFISWSNRFPRLPFLSIGARLRSARFEMRRSRLKFYPGPTEAYGVWRHCFPDFWRICTSPCQNPQGAETLRRIVQIHLKCQGRSRFLAKMTGPPMFSFLQSLFPGARFVWVDRDPRAVTYSYSLRQKFREPPGTPADKATETRLRRAAERYLTFYRQLQQVDEEFMLFLYEDFIANPVPELRRLVRHLELEDDRKLLGLVADWPVRQSANKAWQDNLSYAEKELLTRLLDTPLRERGYR